MGPGVPLINANSFLAPFGPPVLQVGSESREWLAGHALRRAEAQVVVSRSGASSVADISTIGRPSILIPYAVAAGDHQTVNAQALVEAVTRAGGDIVFAGAVAKPEIPRRDKPIYTPEGSAFNKVNRGGLTVICRPPQSE